MYVSVQATAGGKAPPNANAALEEAPAPARSYLAVDKAPPAVQAVPLYASVQANADGAAPPNPKAAF